MNGFRAEGMVLSLCVPVCQHAHALGDVSWF